MATNNPSTTHNTTALKSKSELFVSLFEADRKRLYAYIFAYVMDRAAADDIFQETSMTLWREFETFELNTNFSKWANGIAFNRVRVYRRNNKHLVLGLSDELMDAIENVTSKDEHLTSNSHRWDVLQDCRAQLRLEEQQIYDSFYVKNLKAQAVADETGRSIFAIRKVVHKLRKKLFDCVDRKKGEELL